MTNRTTDATTAGATDGTAPVQPELPLGTPAGAMGRRRPRRTGGGPVARTRRRTRTTPVRNALDDGGRIDERTRAIGRQGIAAARERLAASVASAPDHPDRGPEGSRTQGRGAANRAA